MPQSNFSSQIIIFGFSVVTGLLVGVLYSIFKVFRLLMPHSKMVVVLSDFSFMLVLTIITAVFSIGFTDGYVRYFVLAGEFLGFLIWKFTLAGFFDRFFVIVFGCIRKTVYYIQKFFVGFIKKVLKASDNMLYNKENKNHTCMAKKERITKNET